MRIALYQGPADSGTVASNLGLMEERAREAASLGAHLLVLPEMFLTGYNLGRDRVHALAEPAAGPSAQAASAIAQRHGIALLYGYPERDGDAIYNAALLIDSEGQRRANYRKAHLFGPDERVTFVPGDSVATVVPIGGLQVGILICYDVEFPESVRLLALAGAELVAVPTALMPPYEFVPASMIPTRAFENQVFVAYANRCGEENGLRYIGQSCVAAPDGSVLAAAGTDSTLIVADLDPLRYGASRDANTYFRDRRPELYAPLASERDDTAKS